MFLTPVFLNSAKFQKHLWIVFGVCLAAAATAFFFVDQRLAQWVGAPEQAAFWLFNREITNIGLASHYLILTILVYILSRWIAPRIIPRWKWAADLPVNWKWLQYWSWLFFLCIVITGIALNMVKFIVGRQRPHVSPEFAQNIFTPMNWQAGWESFSSGHLLGFPSGHSQTLFCAWVFLSLLWPKARWGLFVLISYLIMTRAFTYAHFTSDVIMGACVGYCGTLIVLKRLQTRYPDFLEGSLQKNSKTRSSSVSL